MKKNVLKIFFIGICFFETVFLGFAKEKSIYNHGLELVEELGKISQSEKFISCFFNSGKDFWYERKDLLKPSTIVKCYELNLNDNDFIKMLSMIEPSELDSDVVELLEKKISGAFFLTMLNARMSSMLVALSSVLTTSKLFDSSELKKSTNYIYVFENSYSIFVSFTKGEDKAVLATANYILLDDFINADFEKIKTEISNFDVIGTELKEIKLK